MYANADKTYTYIYMLAKITLMAILAHISMSEVYHIQKRQSRRAHIFQGGSCCWVPLQHLAQHTLCVWRRVDALEQSRISFEGEWGVPQQHAHHLTLVHLLVEEALACAWGTHVTGPAVSHRVPTHEL